MSFRFRLNCEFLEQRDNPSGIQPVDSSGAPLDPPPPQPEQSPPSPDFPLAPSSGNPRT